MKKSLAILLAAPLAVATLAAAQAPADAPPPPEAPAAAPAPSDMRHPIGPQNVAQGGMSSQIERIVEQVLGPLDLTEEQKTHIDEIQAAWLERTAATRQALRTKVLEMQTLRRSQSTPPAELEAKRAELATVQQALQDEIAKLDEEVAAALDPARREKYLATRADMRARAAQPSAHPAPQPARPQAPNTGR